LNEKPCPAWLFDAQHNAFDKERTMQNQQQSTLFAFKLAEKQQQDATPAQQWKVREGVAVAGCTDVNPDRGLYRASTTWSVDGGIYC